MYTGVYAEHLGMPPDRASQTATSARRASDKETDCSTRSEPKVKSPESTIIGNPLPSKTLGVLSFQTTGQYFLKITTFGQLHMNHVLKSMLSSFNLINEPERLQILKDYIANANGDLDINVLLTELSYFIESSNCLKQWVIKNSDNISHEYLSYPSLVKLIKKKKNFSYARYQDGEWTCMLKIEPHFSNKIPKYGIEIDALGDQLLNIIKSQPKYYIAINAGVLVERSAIVWPYLEKIKKLVVGEIFRRRSVEEGLGQFIEALSTRSVILVGPSWTKKLEFPDEHIESPFGNLFHDNQIEILREKISSSIKKYESPVVLYSCSLVAKILIDDFFKLHTDSITQIDMGAIWDPYCGKVTRPYHKKVVDRISSVSGQ